MLVPKQLSQKLNTNRRLLLFKLGHGHSFHIGFLSFYTKDFAANTDWYKPTINMSKGICETYLKTPILQIDPFKTAMFFLKFFL